MGYSYPKQLGDRITSAWDRLESFLVGLDSCGDCLVYLSTTNKHGLSTNGARSRANVKYFKTKPNQTEYT